MKHSNEDLLKASKVLAEKVISYSDKCNSGEELERVEMCLALDDLADLARMITPDLSDYHPEEDIDGLGCWKS